MQRPKHPCGRPGCPALTDGPYCEAHAVKRPTAREKGYDSAWDRYSRAFLAKHPICADPFNRHPGRVVQAVITGHRTAHKGDKQLFWLHSNHYPLCRSCNGYQCATREGGFGNRIEDHSEGKANGFQ